MHLEEAHLSLQPWATLSIFEIMSLKPSINRGRGDDCPSHLLWHRARPKGMLGNVSYRQGHQRLAETLCQAQENTQCKKPTLPQPPTCRYDQCVITSGSFKKISQVCNSGERGSRRITSSLKTRLDYLINFQVSQGYKTGPNSTILKKKKALSNSEAHTMLWRASSYSVGSLNL